MIEFIIPGNAVGKGRPKFARRGNFVHTYTPEKTASYENLVKIMAMKAMRGKKIISEAVVVDINIAVAIPKSFSKKKRYLALLSEEKAKDVIYPLTKPDVDNVAKGVLDALNGIVFNDDKQVVQLNVFKHYAETPQVKVWIGLQ